MDDQLRAERSAAAMWAQDGASVWLGLRLEAVGPGSARLSLTIAPHHCNGHGICHGGVIFTLADTAFAYACNSRNRRAVAQHNTITYLRPGRQGETLVAEAVELAVEGRSGVCDVAVRGEGGRLLAAFRGVSRFIEGTHFAEDAP